METSNEHAPRVFVVDDDASVREALELLIEAAGFRVETFATPQDFLARPWLRSPSCLVLDMNLPAINGLELQTQLRQRERSMPIIFITGHADIPMTVRAMKAGAIEFLTKPFSDDVLLDAIQHALAQSHRAHAAALESKLLHQRYASLTDREQEVMGLVVAGLLNKQIAGELGAAEQTVKAHRGRVMRKMQASSLADLVRMAAKLQSHA